MVCEGIDKAKKESDIIGRIFEGLVSFSGNASCYHTNSNHHPSQTTMGWQWQPCSEMVIPIGSGRTQCFQHRLSIYTNIPKTVMTCMGSHLDLIGITTYYGGHDIKLALKRFGSNIIFSNGLKDPHISGGVLEDISKSIVAVTTLNGSHCLDILHATKSDPAWLVMQRKVEVKIIEGWLTKYYADLNDLEK